LFIELEHPVFTSLDFATIILFLQSKVVSLASNPQHGGPDLYVYVPSDRMALLYSQAPGSIFVAYDSQGYGGGIVTRLHTVDAVLKSVNLT
jgi:hypothetical protein